MQPGILDENFSLLAVVDVFTSLIWTDRFLGFGEAELILSVTSPIGAYLAEDHYMTLPESDHVIAIESLNVKSDIAATNQIVVKGRSIERILDQRIVSKDTDLAGLLQNGIQLLLNENAINPTSTNRKISRLVFEPSTDPLITALEINTQIPVGLFLYDVILDLCTSAGIGFKITLNELGKLVFKLYTGSNRSSDQEINPHVEFSTIDHTLTTADYLLSTEKYKNTTMVLANGSGEAKIEFSKDAEGGPFLELYRREMFTDGTDVEKSVPTTLETIDIATYLTEEENLAVTYAAQLEQRAIDDLAQATIEESFEGEINQDDYVYVFGTDFFMGDHVQVTDAYGHGGKFRVTEFIRSQEGVEIKMYPTFTLA